MSEHHSPAFPKPTRRQIHGAVWAVPVILAAIAAPAASASTTPNPASTWDLKVGFNNSTLQLQHTAGLAIPPGQIILVTGLRDITGLAGTDTYTLSIDPQADGTYNVTVVTLIELYPTAQIQVTFPGKLAGVTATFIGPDTNDIKQNNNSATT